MTPKPIRSPLDDQKSRGRNKGGALTRAGPPVGYGNAPGPPFRHDMGPDKSNARHMGHGDIGARGFCRTQAAISWE